MLNLRIGTKLALTSCLTLLLVAAMVALEIWGNSSVVQSNTTANMQQDVARGALSAKATIRALQLGVSELRLARTPTDVQKAMDRIATQQEAAAGIIEPLIAKASVSENRDRLKKITELIDGFVERAQEIGVIKAKIFAVEDDKSDSMTKSEIAAQISEFENEIFRAMRVRLNPIAGELDELIGQIEEAAVKRAEQEARGVQAQMQSLKYAVVGLSAVVVAVLLASVAFSMLTITRPMRALTHGMLELAEGNFGVVLPGLGRKDEIGDVAQAVETFKIRSAEKARAEAQANAEREMKAQAERAERDRIVAGEKTQADERAAAERAAESARVLDEFDAAVGGIVKAAQAGDFSQRVPLEGKDGVIRNLAAALNSMCENVSHVMDDLVAMLTALAEGDLTRRIAADYHGTFGMLKSSANATAEQLALTLAQVKAAANEVTSAAAEISTSTSDLSQRTEEQAAGLEQTSASMEQIAAAVRKNAENAHEANQLAAGTRQVADRGGQVVASAVEAMSRIEASSHKIADIIGVIDEIARQTNLLALNAAVEAARAGDAGRGFAVVASEVRHLAQRSSQAAKDIKDLITNSSTQVKQGVNLVNEAGQSLREILESIKGVAAIVADIANASGEQTTGIDQINKALAQMDEITQQNSALVEENAATSRALEQQSIEMNNQIGFFRIDDAGHRMIAMAPPAEKPTGRPVANPAPKAEAAGVGHARVAQKRGGAVGRMHAAIATAVARAEEDDWKEF
jgi:methyl-accepting chemotaxis protein